MLTAAPEILTLGLYSQYLVKADMFDRKHAWMDFTQKGGDLH